MCPKCEEFMKTVHIVDPGAYHDFMDVLKALVQADLFRYIGGGRIEKIKKGKSWPNEPYTNTFWCNSCDQKFSMTVQKQLGAIWFPIKRNENPDMGPVITKLKRERKSVRKMNLTEEEKAALREKLMGGK